MLEFINLPFPVCCAFCQLLLKFDWPRKLVTYLSREENIFTSLEKIENAESSSWHPCQNVTDRMQLAACRSRSPYAIELSSTAMLWGCMHHCIGLVSQAWKLSRHNERKFRSLS
jgi:hypothetical protein